MGRKLGITAEVNPANKSWVETNANTNPFNKNVLDQQTITSTVTSIPSPYARMHIFELAFRQMTKAKASEEMRKCVAHCLDIYELLFRCKTSEQLRNNSISIEMHRYQEPSGTSPFTTPEDKYLDALNTFRKSYMSRYNDTSLFRSFFTIAQNNVVFAATSPFTGFYVKENPIEINVDGKLYLAANEYDETGGSNQWLSVEDRQIEFQEFIYKLIKFLIDQPTTTFSVRYEDLWNYINTKLGGTAQASEWDNKTFADTYPEFDFSNFGTGSYGFPIYTNNPVWTTLPNNQKVYIIPNEYDSCALRYMLAPEESANFKLDSSQYYDNILSRKNPINNQPMPWVSIDDFLDDDINIIQGEINNEAYFCVRNNDTSEEAGPEYQVLPPLKKRFFEFFKIDELIGGGENGTALVKFSLKHLINVDGETTCLFTIRVPYLKGTEVHYLSLSKKYDRKHCHKDIGLELGIYPFLKTPANVDDFYRIACYVSNSMNCTDLELIRLSNGYNSKSITLEVDNSYIRKNNGNSDIATALSSKIFYYALEGTFLNDTIGLAPHKDVSFDLLNLKYEIKLPGQTLSKEQLVIPLMKEVLLNATTVNLAIDLGTSNTYVCYSQGNAEPQDFETANSNIGNAHFVKLGKVERTPNTLRKDQYDMSGLYRTTQRCEMIPAYFSNSKDGYHFPIPSVLNIKGTPISKLKTHKDSPLATLFDVNIPFSYYEEGTRSYNGNPIDDVISNFKWFNPSEDAKKAEAMLYAEELCYMLRSNLLARHRDLSNVQLYFTFPLSFDGNIRTYYQNMWKKVYAKYFNKTSDSNFMAAPSGNISTLNTVHWDTESRTPLFSEGGLLTTSAKIISADIGGGSTDIMVYDESVSPVLERCFSYKFAGNNLFCGDVLQNTENAWYTEILKKILPAAQQGNLSGLTQKKAVANDNGRDVIQLMNNCFSDSNLHCQLVDNLKTSNKCTLLLTLHNCAIIYAMADICRYLNDGNWIPKNLFFSGNGSRMLFLNNQDNDTVNNEEMLKLVAEAIFGGVFTDKKAMFGEMNAKISNNPKAATAQGILRGLNAGKSIGAGNVEHWVYYGEKNSSLYKMPTIPGTTNPGGEPQPLTKAIITSDYKGEQKIYSGVVSNVKEFLNIYFNNVIQFFPNLKASYIYDDTRKDEYIDGKCNINYILTVSHNSFDSGYQAGMNASETNVNEFTESLFFSIVSQILVDLCKSLAKK